MAVDQQIIRDEDLLDKLKDARESILREIRKAVLGQDEAVEQVLLSLFVGGHSILTGVPGLAKTLLVRTIASVLDLSFKRIQFTPDLMPADITGTEIIEEDRVTGRRDLQFIRGPVFANIILADEINRTPPKTQAALLEAMQERQITVGRTRHQLSDPFFVLATQNPIEHEGTYPLPEAQLDRFLFKIVVPYPSETEEMSILNQFHGMGNSSALDLVSPVLNADQINALRKQIRMQVMEEKLLQFVARLVHQTRNNKSIYLGASPRASIAIMNASKAIAAMQGRDFVTPDDILSVAIPVLRHRIILSPDKEMEGISEDDVIRQIIQGMDVPR